MRKTDEQVERNCFLTLLFGILFLAGSRPMSARGC